MYRIDYTCYFARLVQGLTDINIYGSLTYFTCIFTSLYKSSLLGGEKGEINDLVSQDSLWRAEKRSLGCHSCPGNLCFWYPVFHKFWLIISPVCHIHFNSNVKLYLFFISNSHPPKSFTEAFVFITNFYRLGETASYHK